MSYVGAPPLTFCVFFKETRSSIAQYDGQSFSSMTYSSTSVLEKRWRQLPFCLSPTRGDVPLRQRLRISRFSELVALKEWASNTEYPASVSEARPLALPERNRQRRAGRASGSLKEARPTDPAVEKHFKFRRKSRRSDAVGSRLPTRSKRPCQPVPITPRRQGLCELWVRPYPPRHLSGQLSAKQAANSFTRRSWERSVSVINNTTV